MTYGLRILPLADDDVDEIASFIARDSTEHALRFYDSINATCQLIIETPLRWAPYGFTHPKLRDVRKRAVLGFDRYLVFYRIDADMVEIVRVIHGARDIPSLLDDSPA
jgi:toxin ParE1/3/4